MMILFFFDRKEEYRRPVSIDTVWVNYMTNKPKIRFGKSENRCRQILEDYFKVPFKKVKPDFLRYKNGKNLELDMYNETLGICCEYDGVQHAEFSPFFHKTEQDFIDQMERDKFKKERCKELGLKLINVPHTVKYENLEEYLIKEIKNLKI